jgi:hypothetical protein
MLSVSLCVFVRRFTINLKTVNLGAMAAAVLQACSRQGQWPCGESQVCQSGLAVGDHCVLRQVMENLMPEVTVNLRPGRKSGWRLFAEDSAEHENVLYRNRAGFDMAYAEKAFGTQPADFSGAFQDGLGATTAGSLYPPRWPRPWAGAQWAKGAAFLQSFGCRGCRGYHG